MKEMINNIEDYMKERGINKDNKTNITYNTNYMNG